MKNIFLAGAIAIYMITPNISYAGGHTVEKFMLADTDKDGVVSKNEFVAKYETKFTNLDANNDQTISSDEYAAYMELKYKQHQKEVFTKMDKNGDGTISFEEMSTHRKSWKHKH